MGSTLAWYAGRCIKRGEHDKPAQLKTDAQQVNGAWQLIENREALFKHIDRLELRAADARQVRVDEWFAFTMTPSGPRASVWKVPQYRRLFWYLDLSEDGGQERLHRRLLAEGIKAPHPRGTWIVRCAEDEVLLLDLRQQDGTAYLAGVSSKVLAYRFNPASVTLMPTADGEIQLYDLDIASAKGSYDWSGDDAFALRIIRAAASAGDVEAHKLIPWLENFSKQGRVLSALDPSDVASAHESIRAGHLAKQLADDQALLRKFIDTFATNERVGGLMNAYASHVAEQERENARVKAEKAIALEIKAHRDNLLREVESEIRSLERTKFAELDADRIQRLEQLDEDMDRQLQAAEEAMRRNVEVRRAAIVSDIDGLEIRRVMLTEEANQLESLNQEARGELASLSTAVGEANAALETIHLEARNVQTALQAELAKLVAIQMKCPTPVVSSAGVTVLPPQLGKKIQTSSLLSLEGKQLMLQFVALMAAGEVPVLCGPGVSDFLAVAEAMFASGRAVRLEADPTIITFEDLWVRPGAGLCTSLGHALRSAGGVSGAPRTNLAVIERAERSGARFWYPSLLQAAQRGDLPRRLLMCVTVEDVRCEESRAIFSQAVRLDIGGALSAGAEVALAILNANGLTEELDLGEARADIALVITDVIGDAQALGAGRTARALQALAQMRVMHANAPVADLIKLFQHGGTDNTLRSVDHA